MGEGSANTLRLPSGPRGSLLLGSLREYRRDLLGFLQQCFEQHGAIVPVRVVFHHGYLISSPELIGDVLIRRHYDFRKVFPLRQNRLFLGEGLLTSEGQQWRSDRRLVQPSFHAERISGYADIVVDETLATTGRWRHGEVHDVQEEMAELTLRAVVRCLFDTGTAIDFDRVARAIEIIQLRMRERYRALIPLPDSAWTPRNLRLRRALRELDQIVYSFIRERRALGWRGRSDLISTLMGARTADGSALSDHKLRDQVMTMFFAGHETTALVLSWSLYLLSLHPEVQTEMRAEVDSALGGRLPTAADVPRLHTVVRVVKEAMRLFPPVYAFGRDAVRDTEVGGHRIRAGASAIIAPWVLHRNPVFFDAPTEFRPQRWTEEFERTLPKHAYCPFGGGARMCLGKGFAMMEAVLVLALLVRNHRFQLLPNHQVELWPAFTLRSRFGMPIAVRAR